MDINNFKLTLFTNNLRGIACLKFLIKKKVRINNIIISRKNLNIKVKQYLNKKNIKYLIIKNLKDKKLNSVLLNTDLGLVCGFPHIFKNHQISIPKYGYINLHAGKLPKYRGGSPLSWQIINGEKIFGISAIKINNGIDTGDIIYEKKFRLLKKYKIEDLHRISNQFFPSLLYKSINKIILNKKLKKQKNNSASYFKQRKPEDSLIDPEQITYKKLSLLLRAMSTTYQSPYLQFKNKKIEIKKIKIIKITKNFNNNLYFNSKEYFLRLKDSVVKIEKFNIKKIN